MRDGNGAGWPQGRNPLGPPGLLFVPSPFGMPGRRGHCNPAMEPTDSVIQHIVAVRISGERGPTAVWAPGRDLETEASLAATRLDELLKFGLVADVIVSTARIMPLTQELVQ